MVSPSNLVPCIHFHGNMPPTLSLQETVTLKFIQLIRFCCKSHGLEVMGPRAGSNSVLTTLPYASCKIHPCFGMGYSIPIHDKLAICISIHL